MTLGVRVWVEPVPYKPDYAQSIESQRAAIALAKSPCGARPCYHQSILPEDALAGADLARLSLIPFSRIASNGGGQLVFATQQVSVPPECALGSERCITM